MFYQDAGMPGVLTFVKIGHIHPSLCRLPFKVLLSVVGIILELYQKFSLFSIHCLKQQLQHNLTVVRKCQQAHKHINQEPQQQSPV